MYKYTVLIDCVLTFNTQFRFFPIEVVSVFFVSEASFKIVEDPEQIDLMSSMLINEFLLKLNYSCEMNWQMERKRSKTWRNQIDY